MYDAHKYTHFPVRDNSLPPNVVAYRDRETGKELHRVDIGHAEITFDNFSNIGGTQKPRVDCEVGLPPNQYESFCSSRQITLGALFDFLNDDDFEGPEVLRAGNTVRLVRKFNPTSFQKLQARAGKKLMLPPSWFIWGLHDEDPFEFAGNVIEFEDLDDNCAKVKIELTSDAIQPIKRG